MTQDNKLNDSNQSDSGCATESSGSDPDSAECHDVGDVEDIPCPPDGGWGWVVCVGAFVCMVILDGMMFSFGVLFMELLDYFQEGKGRTAMVGSALMGTHLLAGPITSALVNAWGLRPISILGSVVASIAFACSIVSPSITVLTLLYGVVGGIGVSMVYLPCILSVGFYFEKRRALANGITHSGSGIGTFLYSPLTEYLLGVYGWKGTMLILSGITLNCVACCMLFRPVQVFNALRRRHDSAISTDSHQPVNGLGKDGESLSLLDNTVVDRIIVQAPDVSTKSIHHNPTKSAVHKLFERHNPGTSEFYSSVPVITVSTPNTPLPYRPPNVTTLQTVCKCKAPDCAKCVMMSTPRHRIRTYSHGKLNQTEQQDMDWVNKPLYRKDAFYSGSMSRIPAYQQGHTSSLYSLPQPHKQADDADSVLDPTTICPTRLCNKGKDIRPMLRQMTGFGLMKNRNFILSMMCMVMWTTHSSVLTLLPDCAVIRGVSRSNAAFLISIIGGANTAARVLAGWLSDRPEVNVLHVNIAALACGCVSCVCMAFTSNYALLALESTLFGLGMGTWTSLRPIILVEVLGLDNLTNAFGLVAMFQGIAFLLGPPIAGAVYETIHSYVLPFFLCGVAFFISTILSIVLYILNSKHCKRRIPPTVVVSEIEVTKEV